ncbi:MalY/PatB family protein [Coraliomargarita akajimensis]|uniref:cysteine-S-conjugate beta-lyase n=1 Tax=Coraliomargarita akajimensis (strain DSM 45221 / IAM 15411 / JCM 23193 / KCTC 12865 / 04OKA010-24) TaxID=583355 RepID=D5EJR4_CORAD|nr:PatB family C-S lyase [Coraliomargarita akajimensis]ADE54663.1 aminotransferase class I and II [Coraliomargarita akajimensis DSM 45221]
MTDSLYNFDSCPDRRGYGSLKWDKYKGTDILPLWVADMDFTSAPEITAALQARLDHGIFGYTIPFDEPVDAVLNYLQRQHGYEAKAHWLNFLPGLVPAINLCCHAFTAPGDSVMTATPVYAPFLTAPDYADRELIKTPLCLNGADQWTLDFDAMEQLVQPNTKLFILCSPHNPVARVYTRKELTKLADFCERHDLILISDEIHCDLVFDETAKHIVTATLNEQIAKRTVTLMAPSKTYNLPGLACAFSVIEDSKLRLQFQKTIRGIITEVNCFGYAGCAAAYNHGEPWRQALLTYLKSNYELVYKFIREQLPEITFRPMEATYLAWFDVTKLELDNPIKFFEDNGVGLSDGVPFDGNQHVRLNFGCPQSRLIEGLEKIERAIRTR